VHELAVRNYGLRLAAAIPPVPQFCVLVLVFTFLNYWQHRLNHYRAFWHIHKVHHSATSLTLLTPQRNHPVNAVCVNLTETLPIAMLGFDPTVYLTMRIINSLYQISVHSHLDWGGDWVRRYVLITPAMHWVHHSNKSRHWNSNFGIISLWDALFGTLYVPNDEELRTLQLGIGRDALYNSPGRSRNMLRIYGRFLKHLARDVGVRGKNRSAVRRQSGAGHPPHSDPRTT
jgi:sterol desaturase/sphingolipid hydroxylase (fatty acid hydroxylase superfamily)